MASSKNERATDLIVAQKLKDVGIKFYPNGSSIADIKKALKSASKKGSGRNGYPEYVAQVGDFLLVIKDKADSAHQAKYCSGQDEHNLYIRPIFVSPAGARMRLA